MGIEDTLNGMGFELPTPSQAPQGREGAVKVGNLLFVSGHTPGDNYGGKLGENVTIEEGYKAAQQACLNCLSDVKKVINSLDNVKRVVKLLCMVNATPDFGQHTKVANGATDLLYKLYGEQGVHARSAVGMGSLPGGTCIEIEMILEI